MITEKLKPCNPSQTNLLRTLIIVLGLCFLGMIYACGGGGVANNNNQAEEIVETDRRDIEAESSIPIAEPEETKFDPPKEAEEVMVRATFWDDTKTRPINDKSEIWFRGYGSWWLKPSTKFGGDVKELGKRKIGEKLTGDNTIVLYPDGRQTDETGKERGQRIDIPIKMFRSGEAYTTIEIGIGDKEIEISGFPVKEAIGKATYKVKRSE